MTLEEESIEFAQKLLLLPDFQMWWPGDMVERIAAMYRDSVESHHPEIGSIPEPSVEPSSSQADGWSEMP